MEIIAFNNNNNNNNNRGRGAFFEYRPSLRPFHDEKGPTLALYIVYVLPKMVKTVMDTV